MMVMGAGEGSHNSALWVRNVFLENVVLSRVLEGVADVRKWHVVHMAEIKNGEGRGGVRVSRGPIVMGLQPS